MYPGNCVGWTFDPSLACNLLLVEMQEVAHPQDTGSFYTACYSARLCFAWLDVSVFPYTVAYRILYKIQMDEYTRFFFFFVTRGCFLQGGCFYFRNKYLSLCCTLAFRCVSTLDSSRIYRRR